MSRMMLQLRRLFPPTVAVMVLLLGGVAAPSAAQDSTAAPDALVRLQAAFVAGDADALLGGAAERVEITLLGQSRLYSRAQAMYVMRDFFREYVPEQLLLVSENQAEGSWIADAQYRYRGAERALQVYLRLRHHADGWELREIRIEQRQP